MSESRITLETYEYLEHRVHALRNERKLYHSARDQWPVDAGVRLADAAYSHTYRSEKYEVVVDRELGVAKVYIHNGDVATISTYGASPGDAEALMEEVRRELPRAPDDDPDVVPVSFWTLGQHGPAAFRRTIDAPAWKDLEENYPGNDDLATFLSDWKPGTGGQLIFWHGDAGTGKTTALRSLGREWREWVELHYIVDPEVFFGSSSNYMVSVMMGGGDEGDYSLDDGGQKEKPWRLLILEDCGELLQLDARREVGQSLSRLLNACDGLIGRGLRLLVLITTNEPLEKVHEAVARPGRCAAKIEFRRFTDDQARDWLGHPAPVSLPTLADLYAIRDERFPADGKHPMGFVAR